jgi:hypothetical protein
MTDCGLIIRADCGGNGTGTKKKAKQTEKEVPPHQLVNRFRASDLPAFGPVIEQNLKRIENKAF